MEILDFFAIDYTFNFIYCMLYGFIKLMHVFILYDSVVLFDLSDQVTMHIL